MTLSFAAAHWCIDIDPLRAFKTAVHSGAHQLYVDFSNSRLHGSPRGQDSTSIALFITQHMAVPVVGLSELSSRSVGDPATEAVVVEALECGILMGVRGLFLPLPALTSSTDFAHVRTLLSRVCQLSEGTGITISCHSSLHPDDCVTLGREIDHESLEFVLDTRTVLDAGLSLDRAAEILDHAGLLHQELHFRDPLTREASIAELLPSFLTFSDQGRILMKNDYRGQPRRLSDDIARIRGFFSTSSEIIRLPH